MEQQQRQLDRMHQEREAQLLQQQQDEVFLHVQVLSVITHILVYKSIKVFEVMREQSFWSSEMSRNIVHKIDFPYLSHC